MMTNSQWILVPWVVFLGALVDGIMSNSKMLQDWAFVGEFLVDVASKE